MSFAIIFAFCELGAQVTNQFNTLHEELYQSEWYSLPIEMQRMMVIFMFDAQLSVLLRGYGNISCTRNSFKNVHGFQWELASEFSSWFYQKNYTFFNSLQIDHSYRIFLFYDASANWWINEHADCRPHKTRRESGKRMKNTKNQSLRAFIVSIENAIVNENSGQFECK